MGHDDRAIDRSKVSTVPEMPDDLRSIVPSVGSIWEWEPLNEFARQTMRVTDVRWNGEEAWIESEPVNPARECAGAVRPIGRVWNELGHWVQATVLVEPAPGDC